MTGATFMQLPRYTLGDWDNKAAVRTRRDHYRLPGTATFNPGLVSASLHSLCRTSIGPPCRPHRRPASGG